VRGKDIEREILHICGFAFAFGPLFAPRIRPPNSRRFGRTVITNNPPRPARWKRFLRRFDAQRMRIEVLVIVAKNREWM
jgi:hypothetical protein